ncbi:MAG: hypothetical protein ACK4SN_11840 [Bellilinea sp.]
MNLVCLIGEQPIPNLLPILHLRPARALLVHSNNEGSRKAALRLQGLCAVKGIQADVLDVGDAYRVETIYQKIREKVTAQPAGEWRFNLTGGTKLMSLAALQTAADLKMPCVYYQTEGERGRQAGKLLHYRFESGGHLVEDPPSGEILPALLTLDDYLRAHLEGYQKKPVDKTQTGWVWEEAVYQTLKPRVDEILRGIQPQGVKEQIEIDLLIRVGNQVGVIEVKTGGEGSGKHAVDQLTTAAAREYLGTYAVRFLVTQTAKEDRYKSLAQTLRVNVIELRGPIRGGRLNEMDEKTLLDKIQQKMPALGGNSL